MEASCLLPELRPTVFRDTSRRADETEQKSMHASERNDSDACARLPSAPFDLLLTGISQFSCNGRTVVEVTANT